MSKVIVLIPERDEIPHSGEYSKPETVSKKHSRLRNRSLLNRNKRFDVVGNVVYEPSYKVRKSGKRIADLAIATHSDEETTEYWRIRAFDKQAHKVRDQVQKGHQIEASVYGPKHWTVRKKAKDGSWESREVQGYYAGFVKPKRNHEETPKPDSQEDVN